MLKNLYQSLRGTTNPTEVLKAQMNQIPGLQKTIEQINAAGDPQKAFMQAAIQNGIDQSGMMQMINQLKSLVM